MAVGAAYPASSAGGDDGQVVLVIAQFMQEWFYEVIEELAHRSFGW